jgi:hypothetical protein
VKYKRELLGFFFFGFLLRIAFFADFAVFLGFNAARMGAFFASRFGFFATGFLCHRFAFGHGGTSNERKCARCNRQQFDELHTLTFRLGRFRVASTLRPLSQWRLSPGRFDRFDAGEFLQHQRGFVDSDLK